MATTQIDGGRQIKSASVTGTQVAASTIADSNLVTPYIKADGTRAFTGNQSLGGFELTNVLDPTTAQSAATKNYVDSVAQGLDVKLSVRVATTAAGTLASSFENGDTVDGVVLATNDRILIKDQGTGSENGIYTVNASGAPTRATDANTSAKVTANLFVFVSEGTTNADSGWTISTNDAIVLGTTPLVFTQFSGAGQITVDSTLTKTGNQIVRSAITGDVSIPGGSNTSTIGAGVVTLAQMANLAASSVIGNLTGSPATPAAVTVTSGATASTVMSRSANGVTAAISFASSRATTATAAGTTTLVVGSAQFQQFTGSTTQTVVMPDATTLVGGQSFHIANRSTGIVTVNANGGGLLATVAGGAQATFTLITNTPAAGVWDVSSNGVVVASANGFAGTVASSTSTPTITLSTTITGLLKGNGTAISAATAGTDYMLPANVVTRETPSGSVNGSNTAFTLAFTPVVGTEQVFLNGILQEPGAGNDYTISGAAITYLSAPLTGDRLRVNYLK